MTPQNRRTDKGVYKWRAWALNAAIPLVPLLIAGYINLKVEINHVRDNKEMISRLWQKFSESKEANHRLEVELAGLKMKMDLLGKAND